MKQLHTCVGMPYRFTPAVIVPLACLLWVGTPASLRAAASLPDQGVSKPAESPVDTRIYITYAEGKLSADLKNAAIADVLTRIGGAVKAEVRIADGISGKVTTSFQNLSLEEGLARLLSGEGAGIVVGYDQKGTVKLIQTSRRTGAQPGQVVKVRKVRNYFSLADVASSMDMDDVKELADLLGNPNKKDRWVRAAKQIINIKRPEAKPYLKELMHHEDDFVRDQAMNEYAMLVDVEDADLILEMAQDKSWEVRGAAAYISMTLVDDPRQVPVLLELLKDDHISVRDAAIRALGFKKSKEAMPYLEQLLRDLIATNGEGYTRATTSEALYSITGNKYEWMTPEQRRNHDERGRKAQEEQRRAREKDSK